MIDRRYQGKGYGKQTIQVAIEQLSENQGLLQFALSTSPSNTIARDLYLSLGFKETSEMEDKEAVSRLENES